MINVGQDGRAFELLIFNSEPEAAYVRSSSTFVSFYYNLLLVRNGDFFAPGGQCIEFWVKLLRVSALGYWKLNPVVWIQ